MRTLRWALAGSLLAAIATASLADVVGDLSERAASLAAFYEQIDSRAEACPEAACSGAADIRADLASAELLRKDLHADRAALGACTTCVLLDARIVTVDGLAATVIARIDGWDEQM